VVRFEPQRIVAPAVEASADDDEQSQPLSPMGPIRIIQRVPGESTRLRTGFSYNVLGWQQSIIQSDGICDVDDDRGITVDVSLVR
jgi:hypothetical protein